MPDTEAQKVQIKEVLKQRYFPMIVQLPQNWTPDQHEKNRLSRSLAAFAIEKLADTAPVDAANAVVDGGNDNGIDAVRFDSLKNRLWLVQSKLGAAPDRGDNKKFCDGIRDLVAGRFDRFNRNFARLRSEVEQALETSRLRIEACNVHLGDQLGPHAVADLDLLKKELNSFVLRFDWQDLKLSVVHGWLLAEQTARPLEVELTIENWYSIGAPRRAFYGLVTAAQLAELYEQHGRTLFERNIRYYLGAQAVNSAIAATVAERPRELFYLNNGLTAVCSSIAPLPSASYNRGRFILSGFSVVNGAQTIGSIASVKSTGGTISPEARVFITLIEVGTTPDSLGGQITRARNTQNAVQGLHFAALDPNQERLRQELAISGVIYHYRPSAEASQRDPEQFTFDQAAVAMACFSGDTKTIVAAKREISQITDPLGEFYPRLFTQNLSGSYLCRVVRIYNYLNSIFAASEAAETDFYRRMFYRHGRYFNLHILARRHQQLLRKPEINISDMDKTELSRVALELAELIYTEAEAMFHRQKGYLAVFRSTTDAIPLAENVMRRLA